MWLGESCDCTEDVWSSITKSQKCHALSKKKKKKKQSRNTFFQCYAAGGHTVDAGQGYSHVVGKVQAGGDGREVGTKTAEGEKMGGKMVSKL